MSRIYYVLLRCKASCAMEWCLALAEYIQTHLPQVKQITDREVEKKNYAGV